MKRKEITKELKLLKNIEPDKDFIQSTRRLILTAKPTVRFVPMWATSLALAAVLLLLVGSGFILTKEPTISSSLDKEFLASEFNDFDINLQIKEVTYSRDVHDTIASALNEISESKANHLNPSVIKSEQEYINNLESQNNEEEINNLLDKVIF